ncbi:MAG: uroporphyrinogen-III synthase, partial [Comamonas sp.]
MTAPRRILVTRPAHDAQPWVQALREQGLNAVALPLMAIGPSAAPAVQQALARARDAALVPGHYQAVMFVSGNAVQYFFEKNQPLALDEQALLATETRAWTPGPGTERA